MTFRIVTTIRFEDIQFKTSMYVLENNKLKLDLKTSFRGYQISKENKAFGEVDSLMNVQRQLDNRSESTKQLLLLSILLR